jgi:hypothetical protein
MPDQDYPPQRGVDETFEDFGKRWNTYLDEIARGQFRRGVTTGQTREQHERAFRIRTAADAARAIAQVAAWHGPLPQSPWAQRQKLGKSGRLYTLGDAQRNIIRSNKAINNAKAKAARAEIRRANTTRREQRGLVIESGAWRGIPGIAARIGSRRSPFEPSNPVAEELTSIWLGRVLDADSARNRLARATNRRGALAQRPSSAVAGRTNRRGSLAQPTAPATGPSTSSARSARQLPTRSDPVVRDAERTVSESEASREARRVMGTTRELPTATTTRTSTRSTTRTSTLNRYVQRLTGMFSRPQMPTAARVRTRGLPRADLRRLAPELEAAPSRLELGQRLTPLESVGVGSQLAKESCQCPKPKKEKAKKKEFACSNPLVSRSVSKDGIITIKRKLQCQPSKQKLPSAPEPTTPTSSRAPRSSTRADASS